MGLDIDLVKFDKNYFDDNAQTDEPSCTSERYIGTGRYLKYARQHAKIGETLVVYRRYHLVKEVLAELSDGWYQCAFHELSKEVLLKAKEQIVTDANPDVSDDEEVATFIRDVDKILAETDFDKEVITLSWIS